MIHEEGFTACQNQGNSASGGNPFLEEGEEFHSLSVREISVSG